MTSAKLVGDDGSMSTGDPQRSGLVSSCVPLLSDLKLNWPLSGMAKFIVANAQVARYILEVLSQVLARAK